MIRLFIYLFLLGCMLYLFSAWSKAQSGSNAAEKQKKKLNFRTKVDPMEIWVQVYETSSIQEGRMIQARLQEEDIGCIVYEQGKKDIHGNQMLGIGVSVPKSGVVRAQNIIARMPI